MAKIDFTQTLTDVRGKTAMMGENQEMTLGGFVAFILDNVRDKKQSLQCGLLARNIYAAAQEGAEPLDLKASEIALVQEHVASVSGVEGSTIPNSIVAQAHELLEA